MKTNKTASSQLFMLSPRQERISKRLNRLVGPGACAFFEDSCWLMENNNSLGSTTHLVSHLIREIESALRDVLEPFMNEKSYLEKHGEEKHKDEILAILKALEIPKDDPVAVAWLGLTGDNNANALHKRAHRDALDLPRPFNNEFQEFWYTMEIILDKVLDHFESKFIVILKQEDILRSKKQPGKKDAKFLKNNIPNNVVTFNYFFKELTNPYWLQLLFDEGIFSHPPEPIENKEQGTVSYPPWPQSQYLVDMATQKPELVSDIILRIETRNGFIQSDLLDAIILLPPNISAKHTKQICLWLKTPTFLLGDKAGNLVSHLAKGKEIEAAGAITKELLSLEPRQFSKEQDEKRLFYEEPQPRVDKWKYGEFLKSNFQDLLSSAPQVALTTAINALEDAIILSGYKPTEKFLDDSELWRPAIEDHEQNYGLGDARNSLINAVRDSLEYCINQDPKSFTDIYKELEEKRWTIFRRLIIHTVRIFGGENIDLVETYILNKNLLNDLRVRHEYMMLVRDYFSKLSKDKQKKFLDWIRRGPKNQKSDEDPVGFKEHWQLRWLTILKGQLDQIWENYRIDLLKKYKEPEHPDLLAWSSGVISGPTSPLSPEQFKRMSIDEIIDYLHSWKAPQGFTMDSLEGVSRALSAAIADNPSRFAIEAEKFINVDTTYIHGVFQGLKKALENKREFEWAPVIRLMKWVVKQNREIPGRIADHSWDADPDWGWSRTEIARLLETGFNSEANQIPYSLNEIVWETLLPITEDPDPTTEMESKTSMDPATYSINNTRGTAFHSMISYALWKKKNLLIGTNKEPFEVTFSDIPEVFAVLEKHLDTSFDTSTAIRAVYGWRYPNLAYLDHEWVANRKEQIFPKNNEAIKYFNAAWSAFMGFNHPNISYIQDLLSEYLYSITLIGVVDLQIGWGTNPYENLAEHLIVYYALNKIQLDSEIMKSFWIKASPELRNHALSFIGRNGKNASKVMIKRFMKLWNSRLLIATIENDNTQYVEELKAFGWWFVSELFDDDWCLGELEKVLQITGEVDIDHQVIERLANLSSKYPLQTVSLVERMIEGEKKGWGMILWSDHVKNVLSNALSSEDVEAQKAAEALINKLAARGNLDFSALLTG